MNKTTPTEFGMKQADMVTPADMIKVINNLPKKKQRNENMKVYQI